MRTIETPSQQDSVVTLLFSILFIEYRCVIIYNLKTKFKSLEDWIFRPHKM